MESSLLTLWMVRHLLPAPFGLKVQDVLVTQALFPAIQRRQLKEVEIIQMVFITFADGRDSTSSFVFNGGFALS